MIAATTLAFLVAVGGPVAADLPDSDGDPAASSATSGASTTVWSVPVAHTAGVILGMRISLSIIWPGPYALSPLSDRARQFGRAYTMPPQWHRGRVFLESDGDPWAQNVVGHGLFGAEAYGRVRACGGAAWQALAFTVGASVLWEYGIESWNKRPSGIDLLLTPALGAALGEVRHRLLLALGPRPPSRLGRIARFLVDPLGETERRALGTRC